ncbi:OmpA family protein [Roseicella sp. DB1501]|uniref:OmpA family protein n=1 Tax=Roseicella sp. DB1501 TaxID=2730925 RepID=UPI001490E9D3|nr:OmpA family protein [Roseicella sp. DB1501]NOG69698.1 OmpA family protein [Roseicella sp. DB1501]
MRRRLALAALPLLALAACQQPAPAQAPQPVPASVVFFNADSAALDDQAHDVILQAAAAAKRRPDQPVRVRGFAAPDAGTGAFNKALATARAQQVADHLAEAGVNRGRIRIEPRGAVPYDSFPTESRRVEIVIGG